MLEEITLASDRGLHNQETLRLTYIVGRRQYDIENTFDILKLDRNQSQECF